MSGPWTSNPRFLIECLSLITLAVTSGMDEMENHSIWCYAVPVDSISAYLCFPHISIDATYRHRPWHSAYIDRRAHVQYAQTIQITHDISSHSLLSQELDVGDWMQAWIIKNSRARAKWFFAKTIDFVQTSKCVECADVHVFLEYVWNV